MPSHSPSLAALNHNIYSQELSDSFTVTISGLTANESYSVYAFGLQSGVNGVPQTVTITGSGVPLSFVQTLNSSELTINSQQGSSVNTLESYALNINASNTGTIDFNFRKPSAEFS